MLFFGIKILGKYRVEAGQQIKFDHIFVDEYQDLSGIEMAVLNSLHNNSMTLAGDTNQTIFSKKADAIEN